MAAVLLDLTVDKLFLFQKNQLVWQYLLDSNSHYLFYLQISEKLVSMAVSTFEQVRSAQGQDNFRKTSQYGSSSASVISPISNDIISEKLVSMAVYSQSLNSVFMLISFQKNQLVWQLFPIGISDLPEANFRKTSQYGSFASLPHKVVAFRYHFRKTSQYGSLH